MRKKFNWAKILIEAGMIVLSVLVALFINEWKSDYNSRLETEKMLTNIAIEIENNQSFVEDLITYHSSVLENINHALINDSLEATFFNNGFFEIFNVAPKGVIQGDLQNIAWIVAKEEKISNRIDLDEAQVLFSVYQQQSKVLDTIERIIEILSSREIHRAELLEESIITLAIEINEAISQEKDLNLRYVQFLNVLQPEGSR